MVDKNAKGSKEKGIENMLNGVKKVPEGGGMREASEATTERHLERLDEFNKALRRAGRSTATRELYLRCLVQLAKEVGKDFEEITKEDLQDYIDKLDEENMSPHTINNKIGVFRIFYFWLENDKVERDGNENYPQKVSWMKKRKIKSKFKRPDSMPTPEEIKEMINSAENSRDKAIISLAYDGGPRRGEIASLKVRDLEFHEDGTAHLSIPEGKTGGRRILLVDSVPYLKKWLNERPDTGNGEKPLFISLGDYNKGDLLSKNRLSSVVKKIGAKARVRLYDDGNKTKVTLHGLRHASCTRAAKHLTEVQMRQRYGWAKGSPMPSKYSHLAGRDTDNAVRKMHGMEADEEEETKDKLMRTCPRCDEENDVSNKFCSKCDLPLKETDIWERREAFHELVDIILQDEKVQERIRQNDEIKKIAREVA